MAKQLVHYGSILESRMKEQGRTKEFVCKILDCSYDTLRERIKDARFSYDDLRKLKTHDLI